MSKLRTFEIRDRSKLPFYCDPAKLFVAVWLMMLAAFQVHVSYTSSPDTWLAFNLFLGSLISFFAGYYTIRAAYLATGKLQVSYTIYTIDSARLRRIHLFLASVVIGLIVMNWKLYGQPPIFGFFGADTLDYQEYGSLRQVLFTAILVLFVSAPLEKSLIRRWLLYGFAPLCFVVYASRGYLLIMLLQALIVFSLRTRLTKAKIYLIAFSTLGFALFIANLMGNGRNSLGSEALLGYMQIKRQYYEWPTAYLWALSYISTPLSNLCWIVRVYPYSHPSFSFAYSLLPGFWAPKSLEIGDLGSEMIVDGVHTYIAKYYIDFWYFGIAGINYLWGLIAAFMSTGNRLTRNYLTSAALLGCIGFMFFSDFLTILIIVLEIAALSFLQRYVTIVLRPPNDPLNERNVRI